MHKINLYVVLFVLMVSTVLIGMSYGQTSYPMVMSTYPVAVSSGEVTEIEVKGRYNFYGAYKVLFSGTGVYNFLKFFIFYFYFISILFLFIFYLIVFKFF